MHTDLYHWLYNCQQIALRYRLQLTPWAIAWLLRRCLSTWCTEVRKADEQQELVKHLWQLDVWPSGVWSAPFHGLWFPPCNLWKVTLAWWAHTSLWGSSILQPTGKMCHKSTLTFFLKGSSNQRLNKMPWHRRQRKQSLCNCSYQRGSNAPGTKLQSPWRRLIQDVSLGM